MKRTSRLNRTCFAFACSALAAISLAVTGCSLSPAPVVAKVPLAAPSIELVRSAGSQRATLHVTRVAHASVLLDFDGETVLTDPWFSEKSSYHHGEPLGVALEALPKLTAVVASHAHYDHFDIETFKRYPHKDVPFFVGPDMAEAAREAGFTQVRELKPWESATAGAITVTAAPGKHGIDEITYLLSARGMTVYFGADTLLVPELEEIPKRFPSIQLALLAVNGLHALGSQVVMNAEEAAKLAGMLKAEVAIPMHYAFQGSWFTDTFILSRDGTPERFEAAARKEAPKTQVRILSPGRRLTIEQRPGGPSGAPEEQPPASRAAL
jgi:L-ascorbate metabolism protein UlaG (beta-lactamase superfamily)